MGLPEVGWHDLTCEIFWMTYLVDKISTVEISYLSYSHLLDVVQSGKLLN